MRSLHTSFITIALALVVTSSTHAQDAVQVDLIATLRIPGDALDRSGLNDKLEDGTPANQLGGMSAIDYTGSDDRFMILSDRGAGDGAVSYPCRYHEVALRLDPESGDIQWQYLQTHLLRNPIGQPLVGSLDAHAQDLQREQSEVGNATEWTAFDPEGLRCLPGNQVLLSDEYGPRVIVVNDQGSIVKQGDVPDLYRLRPKSGDEFTIGTFPNRGFEGIAVNADRKGFLAALQSPLIQDGVIENGKCLGVNCRWWLRDQGRDRQIVYRLETEKTGVSEVLAVDANRYIVLERDSEAGEAAAIKRLYLIDIQSATDVSQIERLPRDELPADVQAVKKTLLFDLLDPRFGIVGPDAPEKPEGICWGKTMTDGRRTLWLCCDNDFEATQPSRIYCFAVSGL